MNNTNILKPNKKVFVYYKAIIFTLFTIPIFFISFFVLYLAEFRFLGIIVIPALILINIIYYFYRVVRYKKEEYELQDQRIIFRTGGFFTDHETELVVKNITQIWVRLPFIERNLFKTGNLKIKAAGSSRIEVLMSSIDKPKESYNEIEKLMVKNGFVLARKNLIMKEKPYPLAVIIENIKMFIYFSLFAFLFPVSTILIALQNLGAGIALTLGFLIFTVILGLFLISIVNNIKKTYYLYDDLLEYYDGFMTISYSLIPIENLSDTETNQTFIEKVLGIYDVKLSSQGSGNEIVFRNMSNGKQLKSELDRLITSTKSLISTSSTNSNNNTIIKNQNIQSAKKSDHDDSESVKKPLNYENSKSSNDFTCSLKMDFKRTIMPPLIIATFLFVSFFLITGIIGIFTEEINFLALIPFGFLSIPFVIASLFIPLVIGPLFTTFKVNKNSIEKDFNFLTSNNIEYNIEKITLMQIKESIIDKIFGTFSIKFSTIGGGQNIIFANILKKNNEKLVDSLRDKLGIQGKNIVSKHEPSFSLIDYCMKNIFIFIFLDIVAIVSIVLGIIINPLFLLYIIIYVLGSIGMYYYKKYFYSKAELQIYKDYVKYRRGIIIDTIDIAHFGNIKDVISVKYPYSEKGSIIFNVAGESAVSSDKGNSTFLSNMFDAKYLKSVPDMHEKLDSILLNHPMVGKKTYISSKTLIKTEKPSHKNSVFVTIAFSIIFVPFVLILPLTIPLVKLYISKITFKIENYRVSSEVGIFFKRKTTVLFNRFDHISVRQGFLGKMYSNGNVDVYTAGSSTPELMIMDIPNHRETYDILEKHYKANR